MRLVEQLGAEGIAAGMHYPTPVHLQAAYADLGLREGTFPVAEQVARETLSLPMFPEITESQVEAVVDTLGKFL